MAVLNYANYLTLKRTFTDRRNYGTSLEFMDEADGRLLQRLFGLFSRSQQYASNMIAPGSVPQIRKDIQKVTGSFPRALLFSPR